MAREEYALIDAERLRERRKSSPDSDPVELKKQLLDHRFDAVNDRVKTERERNDEQDARLGSVDTKLATLNETVAAQGASLKAWFTAGTLFLAIFTLALRLLGK